MPAAVGKCVSHYDHALKHASSPSRLTCALQCRHVTFWAQRQIWTSAGLVVIYALFLRLPCNQRELNELDFSSPQLLETNVRFPCLISSGDSRLVIWFLSWAVSLSGDERWSWIKKCINLLLLQWSILFGCLSIWSPPGSFRCSLSPTQQSWQAAASRLQSGSTVTPAGPVIEETFLLLHSFFLLALGHLVAV